MEAELVAAIAAAPEEMGPRLVYADWLLDQGDERGELITIDDADRRGQFERFVDDPALHRLMELAARYGFPRRPDDPPNWLDSSRYRLLADPHFPIRLISRTTNTAAVFPNAVESALVRGPWSSFECEVLAHIASRAARLGRPFTEIDVPYREAIAQLHALGPPPAQGHPVFGVIDYERWCGLWKRWFRRP